MKLLAVMMSLIFFLVFLPCTVLAGPAFSGIAANADSAETVVNNPAGMMRLKQPSVYGNPKIFYTRSEASASDVNINTRRIAAYPST
jgi:long-subunit fatty acid transport protein